MLLCLDTVAWADEISFSSSIVDTTDSSMYLMTSATRRANDNLSRHGRTPRQISAAGRRPSQRQSPQTTPCSNSERRNTATCTATPPRQRRVTLCAARNCLSLIDLVSHCCFSSSPGVPHGLPSVHSDWRPAIHQGLREVLRRGPLRRRRPSVRGPPRSARAVSGRAHTHAARPLRGHFGLRK